MSHTTTGFKMITPSDSWSLTKERHMAGEHGGCCCNHDDQHDNHDHHDKGVQAPPIRTIAEAAGCCGGAANDNETSRSNHDHAGHSAAARSSS